MITISKVAAETLAEALKASGVQAGQGLRLRDAGERLNLDLDSPSESDRIINHGGSIVLIVGKDVEEEIGDAVIDVDTDGEEPRMVIRRKSKG